MIFFAHSIYSFPFLQLYRARTFAWSWRARHAWADLQVDDRLPKPRLTFGAWIAKRCRRVIVQFGARLEGGWANPTHCHLCILLSSLFHPQNWNAFEKYCRPAGSCTRIFQQSAAIVIRCFDQRSEASASDIRHHIAWITHDLRKNWRWSGRNQLKRLGVPSRPRCKIRFLQHHFCCALFVLWHNYSSTNVTCRQIAILLIGFCDSFLSNIYTQARIVIHLARTQR